MTRMVLSTLMIFLCSSATLSQMSAYSFGEGLNVLGKDSSFSMKVTFRFQTLIDNNWTVSNDDFSKIGMLNSEMLIRRARLKAEGFAYSPKLKYKFEIGLANRDIRHNNDAVFGNSPNIILDAYLLWNFYKGFSFQAGQAKLPGNRERIISSGNMQFVDRSILNAAFTLDRDIGVMLIHAGSVGKMKTKLTVAMSQGAGRNVIAGNFGGFEYTFRGELLPFGNFTSKGEYVGSDLSREQKPKLAIAATFDYNEKSVRTRNNLGNFMVTDGAKYKDVLTGIVDFMFKYKGFSMMGEYAIRATNDRDAKLIDANDSIVGIYKTGAAINVQAGYLFKSNIEVALRYSMLNPQNILVGNSMEEYTIGFSKFIVGHHLKIQTDIGYLKQENSDDSIGWRLQLELCF